MNYKAKVHLYGVRQRGLLRWEAVKEVEDWLDHYCYAQDLIVAFEVWYWEAGAGM